MKKLILIVCCVLISVLSVKADIMPYSVNDINPKSIGVYQAENSFKIYKEPNLNSDVIADIYWNEKGVTTPAVTGYDLFIAFYPKKNLAFLTVMDESDDMEWVKVLYKKNLYGWVKIEDPYRYNNWRSFFGNYGRKYGVSYLKGTPESSKNLYGSFDENSKLITSVKLAKGIKLTNISGNWVLVIVYDIDNSQKIGWLKWRTKDGEIFLFPAIK